MSTAVAAGGAAASPSKYFLGKIVLIWAKFEENLGEFGRNLGKRE